MKSQEEIAINKKKLSYINEKQKINKYKLR